MKETIEYYYDLKIEKLYIENEIYHFIIENTDYYFVFFNREDELSDIIAVSNELKKMKIDVHDIILNNEKSVITKIENISYVLLRVRDKNKIYDINDILDFTKKLKLSLNKSKLYRNNWGLLWEKKIDFIEDSFNEVDIPKIVEQTLDYYIGLGETAISIVNNISKKYSFDANITLSHRRIYMPNIKLNYLNPLAFIFDLEVRDIAEYLKMSFFYSDDDPFLDLQAYLKMRKISFYEANMLYARLIYPSYYFDLYEKIINKKIDSKFLLSIVTKINEYKCFLKKAYDEISKYSPLEDVRYLIE